MPVKLFSVLFLYIVYAHANDDKLVSFLKDNIKNIKITTLFEEHMQNPEVDISVAKTMELSKPKGWKAYLIEYKTAQKREFETFYIGKGMLTTTLFDIDKGKELPNPILASLEFNAKYYDKKHLVCGNKDARHTVVIFSDPLCTSCRLFVPDALSYMRKYPKTFRVYHFYFPLYAIHPASEPLIKAAISAKEKGYKNVFPSLYQIGLDTHELDLVKIVDKFNAMNNSKVTLFDILDPAIERHLRDDQYVAEEHLVTTTPTVFLDGKKDETKVLYKSVKLIK